MKYKVLISNKEDWIIKTEGKIDLTKFDIIYGKLEDQNYMNNFDAIIPLYESEVIYLNKFYSNKFREKYLLPKTDVLKICEDKKSFYEFMTKNGFSNFTPLVSQSLPIPFILKKRIDEWGKNAFIIQNKQDLNQYKEQLLSKEFIRQEYFFGKEEFTTHFLFKDDEIKYLFTLKFVFKNDCYVKGAPSPPFKTANITVSKTDFIHTFTEILKSINYEGVGCFNYKIKDGVPKIFEINPRVGGSLPLDVNNFLSSYVAQLEKPPKVNIKKGGVSNVMVSLIHRLKKYLFNIKKILLPTRCKNA